MGKLYICKEVAPLVVTVTLACSRGFLQDNRETFEAFEEKNHGQNSTTTRKRPDRIGRGF